MDIFNLVAKLSLDSKPYEDSLKGAEKQGKGWGDKFKSALGGAAKAGVAATGAAVGAAAAGVMSITKNAVSAYADYQQLIGGVETLFGDAQNKVVSYASEAWKTAGLSANEYMEQATSMSAALVNSLGGDQEKAAEKANLAITDMSDNANKMGTDMEAIQNAYSGFSKDNFTMLDNLKLGYGGTKEEMQRLIDKANEINKQNGEATNYQIDNYSDIVDAIHTVQTEMGVTGTTADEAMTTISGAAGATKSAWENVLSALGGGGDLGEAIDSLITSLFGDDREGSGLIAQLLPVMEKALTGIADGLVKLAPVLSDKLPAFIEKVAPPLIKAIIALTPVLIKTAWTLIKTLLGVLGEYLGKLGEWLSEKWEAFKEKVSEKWEEFKESIKEKIDGAKEAIKEKWEEIKTAIKDKWEEIKTAISDKWEEIKTAISDKIEAVRTAISDKFEEIKTKITDTIENIKTNLSEKWQAIVNFAKDYFEQVKYNVTHPVERAKEVLKDVVDKIKDFLSFTGILDKVTEIFNKVKSAIEDPINTAKETISNVIETIKTLFSNGVGKLNLKIPHISVSAGEPPWGIGGKGTKPSFSVEWYKDAYDLAAFLQKPTLIGMGDKPGRAELITGEEHLRELIREESAGGVTVNVYGAEGQDVRKLADEVINRLERQVNSRRLAFG